MSETKKLPLEGYRVLDLATMVAAPLCATILGEFGAEVIKVEMPNKGDLLRAFGLRSGTGSSFTWLSEARNKKSITLDLRTEQGLELARQLVAKADVVTENFRPGTLEKWGLGIEAMKAINPDIIVVSVSAYGQSGPYKDMPGYARIAHGFSGLSHLCGEPDGAPAMPGASALADYVSGLYASIGAALALIARNRFGIGQHVDVALYEGVFRMLDDLVPVYAKTGYVRGRWGPDCESAVPHSHYRTGDGRWVALACSNDKMFARLTEAMKRPELLERFANVDDRIKHRTEVNGIVSEWIGSLHEAEVMKLCADNGVPLGPINTVEDIFNDPHIAARGNLARVDVPGEGPVTVPSVLPRLSETPGKISALGPELGQHNVEIYCDLLGLSEDRLRALRESAVV
jgi:crotonobetainyl-CoA:carnitine CoA-transferase CaiB-like acyl-CoA transferase